MSYVEEIKKAMEQNKVIKGNDETVKAIRQETIEKVFVTSNYPDIEEIKELCEIHAVNVEEISETNEELGALCKTPFSISLLGIKKE